MMTKIKTADLIPPALDWAVDKAEGHIRPDGGYYCGQHGVSRRYSTDWSQGGPIIERERINLLNWTRDWDASMTSGPRAARRINGDTPLIAAMRCYVARKLGDEVDVPAELTGTRWTYPKN